MNAYEIEQSKSEVQKVYSELIDKITEHVKVLSQNDKPITSVMAMKRDLIRMKIGYVGLGTPFGSQRLQPPQGEDRPSHIENIISEEEETLAMEILESMGIDVKPAACAGLLGIREMKRALVKYHYKKMAKEGMKYKDIKTELSKRYDMSVASIEKMVYRNAGSVGQGARKS